MKRLGPDLKMPNLKRGDVKVPAVVGDLYYDLRERRLLAPLALLLVAILAVPFVLGSDAEEPTAGPQAGAAAPPTLETSAAKLTVVEAKPGLRDYRKRLAARQPTNPFKQRYSSPQVKNAELEGEPPSQTTSVTTGGSTGSTTTGMGSSTSTNTPTPASTPGTRTLTFFTWGIGVWIHKVPSDSETDDEELTRPRVFPQSSLPGEGTPVATFMGLSRQAAEKDRAQRALFVVSDEVTKVLKGGKCVSRGEGVCEQIEAGEGESITFAYGPGETRYTIKVLKIQLFVAGHS